MYISELMMVISYIFHLDPNVYNSFFSCNLYIYIFFKKIIADCNDNKL